MALTKRFEQTEDRQVNSLQKTSSKTITTLNACPFIVGFDTGQVTFTSGQMQMLPHKLGHSPSGVMLIDAQTGYSSFRREASDSGSISIRCEHAGTYRFWVY